MRLIIFFTVTGLISILHEPGYGMSECRYATFDISQYLPSFQGQHGDIGKFAFCLALLIFILCLAKIILRPRGD